MPKPNPYIIISLGGSLIVPKDGIATQFIKDFRRLILTQIKKGRRFILICGGGTTARQYQNAAAEIVKLTRDDLDWLGIHVTRLNGHLMRTVFRDIAHPRIITDPHEPIPNAKLIIAAGWRPGCSTDYDAVLLAQQCDAKTLINLSNITYVYDKDPRTNKDAKPITTMNWKNFRKQFGGTWHPGLNSPFDPVAAKAASEQDMQVIIADGANLKNLEAVIAGEKYVGTTISGNNT
jgi:uridylate kinase